MKKSTTPLFLVLGASLIAPLAPYAGAAPSSIAKVATSSPHPAATLPKFAVLVGITDYKSLNNVGSLKGCLNDVRDMRQKLISDFGFAPQNILVLENKAATHDAIVNAFRTQLRDHARSNPSGTFLFYFSGHGSVTEDKNGDERINDPNDTQDETLLAYDGDLVDDHIDILCREVRSVPHFTGTLTTITDSCHSGTVTRQATRPGDPVVRSAPEDAARPHSRLTSGLQIEGADVSAGSLVAFSGCLDTQMSEEHEYYVPDPKKKGALIPEVHGTLTHHLLAAMDTATKRTTNSQIWTQISEGVLRENNQMPQLEGGYSNAPFLGGSLKEVVPPITYSLVGNTLTFPKGVEVGAIKGGYISILKGGKSQGAPLTITSAQFGKAKAFVPPNRKIASQGTIQILTPYFGSDPLTIGLGMGISPDNPVVKRLRDKYNAANSTFVRLAKAGEKPGIQLMCGERKNAFGKERIKADAAIVDADQKGYFLASAPGQHAVFGNFFSSLETGDVSISSSELLFQTLESYAAQRNLRTLSNQLDTGLAKTDPIEIKAFLVTGKDVIKDGKSEWTPDDKPGEVLDLDKISVSVGQRIRFQLRNRTTSPLYVSMLWLSDDGSITPIEDVKRRTAIGLLGHDPNLDTLQRNDIAFTRYCRMSAPIGKDTIKVFVSAQPINIGYLQRDAVIQRNGAQPLSPFDIIAGQATGTRAPRPETDEQDFESWGTKSITVSISSP